jgi:hypothetical protein
MGPGEAQCKRCQFTGQLPAVPLRAGAFKHLSSELTKRLYLKIALNASAYPGHLVHLHSGPNIPDDGGITRFAAACETVEVLETPRPRPGLGTRWAGPPYRRRGSSMLENQGNTKLPTPPPEYLTAQEAAPIARMSRPTLTKYLQPAPDAWYLGPRGQRWPLWLKSTLERHRAERAGGAQ